jgi:hypothetical protein
MDYVKAIAQGIKSLRYQKLLDEGRWVFGKAWFAERKLYLPRRGKILAKPDFL